MISHQARLPFTNEMHYLTLVMIDWMHPPVLCWSIKAFNGTTQTSEDSVQVQSWQNKVQGPFNKYVTAE